jgi:putative tryptophan/tyrosine transport system substrate-binding protein
LAAGGARAAARPDAAGWVPVCTCAERSGSTGARRSASGRARATRMDRAQHSNENRFAWSDAKQMQAYAAELVGSAPDVIVANSTPALAALKQATPSIPIVLSIVSDPAGQGFVARLGRPGGNITGFSFAEFAVLGKRLEALKEIAPSVKRIALVFNPQVAPYYRGAAAMFAAELSATPVHDEEIEAAASAFAREPGGGLIVAPDPLMDTHRAVVIALAERHRLPVIYGNQSFVRDGRLISYGPDTLDIIRRSTSYIDRVLRGGRPGEPPVQAPAKYELLINLKTVKALGLAVRVTLRVRADQVIG